MYQDRELAARRAVDQRRAAVDQVRRELSSRLEAIKLQEINRLMRPLGPSGARGSENPAVIFIASLENDRLVLPGEAARPLGDSVSKEFAQHRQAGEIQEFIQKDYAAAAKAYRLTASAKRAGERGEARLALARTLLKAGRADDASSQYRLCSSAIRRRLDEQGVGYRIYAGSALSAAGRGGGPFRQLLLAGEGFEGGGGLGGGFLLGSKRHNFVLVVNRKSRHDLCPFRLRGHDIDHSYLLEKQSDSANGGNRQPEDQSAARARQRQRIVNARMAAYLTVWPDERNMHFPRLGRVSAN